MNHTLTHISDEDLARVTRAAENAGRGAGAGQATWFEVDSEAHARATLDAIDNCDFDGPPAPFSGEWADGLRVEDVVNEAIADALPTATFGHDDLEAYVVDEIVSAFETEYYSAFEASVGLRCFRYLEA